MVLVEGLSTLKGRQVSSERKLYEINIIFFWRNGWNFSPVWGERCFSSFPPRVFDKKVATCPCLSVFISVNGIVYESLHKYNFEIFKASDNSTSNGQRIHTRLSPTTFTDGLRINLLPIKLHGFHGSYVMGSTNHSRHWFALHLYHKDKSGQHSNIESLLLSCYPGLRLSASSLTLSLLVIFKWDKWIIVDHG